jgi:selenocysteine lyase/cysteine desulfurase
MSANRRSFLGRITAAAAALAVAPGRALGLGGRAVTGTTGGRAGRWVRDGLPAPPPGPLPVEFWHELRGEFLIPADEAFFNTGTLGSSPKAVVDALVAHLTHVERDVAHWDYKEGHEQFFTGYAPELGVRSKIAALVNADAEQISLTQNATFGMNFMANGLPLEPGDEVVVMRGAHPGGRGGWELKDARHGPAVRFVDVPVPPESPEQLTAIFEAATTPRTRVWAIPHLTSGTAILFPVAQMCRRARERGILTVVDGAQTFGHLALDLRAMDCDAFFTSPHKWMLAPVGTGFLYVRKELAPHVWSTLASANWENRDDPGFRLMQYGTGNLSLLVGLEKALDFHAAIGSERVQQRIVGLADRLRDGLHRIPGVEIRSPLHPQLRSATTIWTLAGTTPDRIQDELWDRAKVRVRDVGTGVRQCCHVYTLEEDVDRTLRVTRALARA